MALSVWSFLEMCVCSPLGFSRRFFVKFGEMFAAILRCESNFVGWLWWRIFWHVLPLWASKPRREKGQISSKPSLLSIYPYICTVHSVHVFSKAFLIRSHSDGTRTLPFVSSKRMCLSKTFQGCICNEVRGKVLRKMDMKKTGWHPDHCNLQRQASQKSSSSLEQDFQVNCFRDGTRRRIQ